MDFEVKAVSGIESCFVSLPVSFIRILQSTGGGSIPPLLALELRSRSGGRWSVAWSGSASRSSAIEVAKQVAECISLPDSIEVQVRVVSSLQKAVEVSIEPSTEDDWEVLELNSDLAEDAILKQVGIVYEGMKFPLWLHGHKVVMFHVISTFPKNVVVQLVPGTEVIVAPKLRRKDTGSHLNVKQQSSCGVEFQMKIPLRIQLMKKVVTHQFDFLGVEIGVVLTTAAFIHPETAKKLLLGDNEFVKIIPRLPMNGKLPNHKDKRRNSNSAAVGILGSTSLSNEAPKQTVVRLLYSESAARGHITLPHSICLFLKAGAHSWVYVQKANITPKKNASLLTISPCRFKFTAMNSKKDTSLNELDIFKDFKNKTSSSKQGAEMPDWSLHVKLLSSLSGEYPHQENGEAASNFNIARRKDYLLSAWVVGQLKAITSHAGEVDICSVVLAHETLLQFDVLYSKYGNLTNEHPLSNIFTKKGGISSESQFEIMYILSAKFEESSSSDPQDYFELSIKAENRTMRDVEGLELEFGLDLGDPVSLESAVGKELDRIGSTISSLSWLETASMDAINRLKILLSSTSAKFLSDHHLPLPGHVLLHGPPGSGKTSLALAIANFFEGHAEILAHIIFINCSKLTLEKSQTIRQSLNAYLSEALAHVPSLLIFDDLDHVVSSSSELDGSQSSNSVMQLVEYLIDIMDEYGERRQTSCGIGPIAFIATAQTLGNLPQSLTSSGRFDFHVQLPAPAVSERGAILNHEIKKRSLQCSVDILSDVASKCDGYDSYDLEILVDRAVHAAIGRYLNTHTDSDEKKPFLIKDDFSKALFGFTPVAMRGLTKAASHGGRSGWDDVGGLLDIRNAIQEMVEMPSKFPTIFSQAPLRLRSNVLLYGPPGCGKTHIVGAAAAACSLRFISVKGPELLNKYIGASEQAVRDMFAKAAAAAPCLLFFDEFDSIAPKRGHDNTGVTDRVVNQLLTELDGVEALTGVFVFAATSRPDLLDAALLRPGRLDRLLFCDFPSWHERLDILTVLSKKLPMASDVNLDVIASMTDGFSGADLQALLSDAQLASVHELLDNVDSGVSVKGPVICDELLRSVASKARPSVSESEKKRLYGIYSHFLDSKKSINGQSRDAKGKRATLA